MLGHLKPHSALGRAEYRQFYCSICANLRQDFGLAHTFLINNELTLVIHALSPFAEWKSEQTRCPSMAFLKKNPIQNGILAQKAAHISLVLAWVKAQDWATDSPHFAKKWLAEKLKKQSLKIELSEKFKTTLENYILLIQKNQDFGALRQASAQLSEGIFWELAQFTQIPEKIALSLANIFRYAGEAILLGDHLIDLENDLKYEQYNGILENVAQNKSDLESEKHKAKVELNRLSRNINEHLKIVQEINPSFVEQMQSAVWNVYKKAQGHKITCAAPKKTWKFSLQNKDAGCWIGCCECCCNSCASGTCDCLCDACCNDSTCCKDCNCCDKCCDDCCCDNCCDNCCGKDNQIPDNSQNHGGRGNAMPDDPLQGVDSLNQQPTDTIKEVPKIDNQAPNPDILDEKPSETAPESPASQPENRPPNPFE